MQESIFNESKNKLKYIPQVFAYGMTGVNRKEFPKQGSGTANFVDGIPSVYSIAPSAGGKYVERADINGIGWLATQLQFYMQCGQFITFDQQFCSDIGGYPFGAILQTTRKEKKSGTTVIGYESYFVMSLDDDNMTNFNDDESKIVTDPRGKIKTGLGYWYRLSASNGDISSLITRLEAVETKASKAYKFKGSKATKAALDKVTDAEVGDVWNVTATGDNYAYVEEEITEGGKKTHWDSLGKVFDLTDVYNKIDEAKGQANSYTDGQITSKCLLKTNLKSAYTNESPQDGNVYNVPYINTLLAKEKVTAAGEDEKRGYLASYIDATFLTKESVVGTKSTLESAIYNAVYVNAIEVKAQKGIDDAATAKTAADNAQRTADGAQTAASNAQTAANNAQTAAETAKTTAEGAKSYAEEQVSILLDRISSLEQRLETCENLIRYYHGGSDAEG